MRAILALEDGTVFHGEAFGARATACGEVCFNTSMTGYQEILTDPSYKGQIVSMTYPLIGNYGVNAQDVESWRPHVAGFVIRELSPVVSNWRADASLAEYLEENGIPGIQGVDTRALCQGVAGSGWRGLRQGSHPQGRLPLGRKRQGKRQLPARPRLRGIRAA